jgi:hypothetical protein
LWIDHERSDEVRAQLGASTSVHERVCGYELRVKWSDVPFQSFSPRHVTFELQRAHSTAEIVSLPRTLETVQDSKRIIGYRYPLMEISRCHDAKITLVLLESHYNVSYREEIILRASTVDAKYGFNLPSPDAGGDRCRKAS